MRRPGTQSSFIPELTIMTGIAIIAVVLIHANSSALYNLYGLSAYWNAPYLLRTVSAFLSGAVPAFIFISGYKFAIHDTDTGYWALLQKRLPRVLMSFLIINTFYWAIDSMIYMDHFQPLLLVKSYCSSWLGNTVAYPLWYIPMYCFVLIVCTAAYRIIRCHWLRFLLWAFIGIAQKIAALYFPLLGTKPFMFLSYPLFFEIRLYAQRHTQRLSTLPPLWFFAYAVLGAALPTVMTKDAAYQLLTYSYYAALGPLFLFAAAHHIRQHPVWTFFARYSYPIFLFHEPLFGRLVGIALLYFSVRIPIVYELSWLFFTLAITLGWIAILQNTKLYTLLCRYSPKKE